MKIKGATALVLGAVKGIGRAVALDLARRGAQVAVNYFDWEEHLPELRRDFDRIGTRPLILKTDLLDTGRIGSMVAQVIERFGRLDILINNIERGGWPVVHGPYSREQWDMEQATTLRAKRWVFEATLPHLRAAGKAVVINFSSIAALVGRSGPAGLIFNDGYAAACRAVSSFTEAWARQAAPEVRVNEIMLGIVETRHGPGTRGWALLDESQRAAIVDHTLLGRIGTLDDVVRAVGFIVEDAPFMTGSVLRLDGGYVLGGEPVPPLPKGVV